MSCYGNRAERGTIWNNILAKSLGSGIADEEDDDDDDDDESSDIEDDSVEENKTEDEDKSRDEKIKTLIQIYCRLLAST